jgi:hypothetical protein
MLRSEMKEDSDHAQLMEIILRESDRFEQDRHGLFELCAAAPGVDGKS